MNNDARDHLDIKNSKYVKENPSQTPSKTKHNLITLLKLFPYSYQRTLNKTESVKSCILCYLISDLRRVSIEKLV